MPRPSSDPDIADEYDFSNAKRGVHYKRAISISEDRLAGALAACLDLPPSWLVKPLTGEEWRRAKEAWRATARQVIDAYQAYKP